MTRGGGGLDAARGGEATRLLLQREPRLTAIFVHSDAIAIGVLSALLGAGRQVPGDVAVVSCDDMPFAPHLVPPLTTVRAPKDARGPQTLFVPKNIRVWCSSRADRTPALADPRQPAPGGT